MEKRTSNEPAASTKEDLYDVKGEGLPAAAQDVVLGEMLEVDATPEQERKVRLKLDLVLLPMMAACYMMQYMDKYVLSQATLFNLRQDLNLVGDQFNWTSAIFYFGYLVWSWPSSYLMVRLPIGKYISVCVFLWGGFLLCHAAAKNFAGLMTARFFLGVGEAAIAPGFSLVVGMFYTRKEQPARQAAWYLGNCVANLISGVVVYGIGNITIHTIAQWQLIFLILGAITASLAFWLVALLPDSPRNAIFLNKKERAIALQRTLKNKTGVMDVDSFKWNQVWLAFKDPQTWFLVLYNFCVNLCNGGITSFSSILINGFGYGRLRSLLMQMPMGAAQIVFLVITSGVATYVKSTRIAMMMFTTSLSMMGMILIWKLDADNKAGRLTGLTFGGVFAVNIPLSLSLVSSNVAGFTKRSVISAMIFVAYCVGNIVGPQFYLESEEPDYPTGIKAAMCGLILGIFFLFCLMVYYIWENRRRDALYGPPSLMTENEELAQDLSNKTDQEMESFRYVI
ncbi:hypothetical protein SI65_10112 [Aspergillus cristatus]|uniref:Major facilitator superfamily (MFS) profile domain-containing protein n=1 Tax=Aspergillus cristatus TaxID=573508 RepID=A0A1E3B0M1_ASPCR|nr:hypothetical protein SI65_10112 [Aspergillus cristatus]